MQRSDIERYLLAARGHSIIVDARELAAVPGVVRTITIHRENRVTIEFDRSLTYFDGDGEGWGPKYLAAYADLEDLIADLEDFLGQKLEAWRNYTAEPFIPSTLVEPGLSGQQYFEDLVRRDAVELPRKGGFEHTDIYWRRVAKRGESRRGEEET